MDQFYTDITKLKDKIYHRGYRNGQPFQEEIQFKPTMYLPSNVPSNFRTIDGQYAQPISIDSITGGYKMLNTYSDMGVRLHGMEKFEYQFIVETYLNDFEYNHELIKILNFDIEVGNDDSTTGFPDVELANDTVTTISVQLIQGKKTRVVVFGLNPYTPNREDVTFFYCKTERELLVRFVDLWRKFSPDIITGWNIEFFDVPYLVHRIERVLGEKKSFQLSPYNFIRPEKVYMINKELITYNIFGVQMLDYLKLYQKFTYQNQESYRLDHIAHVELDQRKVSYSEYQTLSKLYSENYDMFIEYAIRDVELVTKLEEKLGLLKLVITLAHTTRVNFCDTMKQVRMWDIFIYLFLTRRNIVPPPIRTNDKFGKYEGAYVKDPQVGKHEWIVSYDINSLYPNLIRFLNISPETLSDDKVDIDVQNFLQNGQYPQVIEGHSIAANGSIYKKENGLLPDMVRYVMKKRVHHRGVLSDYRNEIQRVDHELKRRGLDI